jgi:hypothetical protein
MSLLIEAFGAETVLKVLFRHFSGGSERKTRKASVRTAGALAKTRTEHLPITSLECYL